MSFVLPFVPKNITAGAIQAALEVSFDIQVNVRLTSVKTDRYGNRYCTAFVEVTESSRSFNRNIVDNIQRTGFANFLVNKTDSLRIVLSNSEQPSATPSAPFKPSIV